MSTRAAEPMWDLQVAERTVLADDVVSLSLTRSDSGPLPAWEPGAHVDVLLPSGLVRQYSLTGRGDDPTRWEIAVLREAAGRGGSEEIHSALQPGVPLTVRGPRNHFGLVPARRYRFIAGGIGITPIRAMLHRAEALGSEWQLLYGGRSAATMAYVDELQAEYGDRVVVRPQDRYGLLDLASFLDGGPADALVYACGPEPLLEAVESEVARRGAAASLHTERFAPAPVDPGVVDVEFEVELVQTGVTITVPADRSLLSVAEEAGAFVTTSCEEGTCGSCQTAVLAGVVDHRDSVLGPEERAANDTMMVCVSRCRGGRLVLDL